MNPTIERLARLLDHAHVELITERSIARTAEDVARRLEADLNAAVESNRTLAASEAESYAQGQQAVRKANDERDAVKLAYRNVISENLRILERNNVQKDTILNLERQIREADQPDPRLAELETEVALRTDSLNDALAEIERLTRYYGAQTARLVELGELGEGVPKWLGEGVPKWGKGLTRDQLAAMAGNNRGLELISPWLHGRWTVVAILTPDIDVQTDQTDIILRPAYGTSDGMYVTGRIDSLQLDNAEF